LTWFEHVISHQPTVGTFYEIMLRNALKELAPQSCQIATGFVLDPYRPIHSKQLDIIAFDQSQSSPVFKNGELVVVRPSSVVSLTEVKKTLRFPDIEQTIDATMFANLGTRNAGGYWLDGVQNVNIFGFSSKLKPENIAEKIRDYLDRKIEYTRVRHRKTKKVASLILDQVVLPSIFVRNDRFYINCGLSQKKADSDKFRIEVAVHESRGQNGCVGAFLLHALPMLTGEQSAFIGSDIQVIKHTVETKETLLLHTMMSMGDVYQHFPREREKITKFRIKGRAPHSVTIPKTLRWNTLSGFDEFVHQVGIRSFRT
jgi:hypothetical protein